MMMSICGLPIDLFSRCSCCSNASRRTIGTMPPLYLLTRDTLSPSLSLLLPPCYTLVLPSLGLFASER